MELHHHPHVEKKNFKEYFLEFLMIFLAVTMGFIAENIRENIDHREIEKRDMEIILSNLKSATTQLNFLASVGVPFFRSYTFGNCAAVWSPDQRHLILKGTVNKLLFGIFIL